VPSGSGWTVCPDFDKGSAPAFQAFRRKSLGTKDSSSGESINMRIASVSSALWADEVVGVVVLGQECGKPAPVLMCATGAGEFKEKLLEMCETTGRAAVWRPLAIDRHGHGQSGGQSFM